MTNYIYKIKFYKSSFDINEAYDRLSDVEKDNISELDSDSFFDYEDEHGRYTCYVIASHEDVLKYSKILTRNLIDHDYTDISDFVLRGKIDLEKTILDRLDESNSFKYDFFMDDVNNWIYLNLDIDTVLDRISEVGMDSLKEVEYDFLNTYRCDD